jgi:uncharacterized protein YdaU (DUF1376 family)
MQLYVADYLADTAHLTTEEHGAYLLLLFSYWQTGKPLRSDRLASVSRLSNERWTDVEQTLREFFHVSKGVWTHFRVEADLEKVESKSKKNSSAGKASAKARALAKQELEEGDSTNVGTNVEQTYQRNVNHTDTDTDTDTEQKQGQKPSSKKPAKPKNPKPAFQLPEWINAQAWASFVEMRVKIKKPMTDNAMGLAVKALEKLEAQGHRSEDVLNQSTFNSWQGLFAIKQDYSNGQAYGQRSGESRPSLSARVRQANAHLLDDEPPPIDERDWPEFDSLREIDGKIVGPDD